MKVPRGCVMLVVLSGALFLLPAGANATVIVNGGFETGTLAGWTVTENVSSPNCPMCLNLPNNADVYGAGIVAPGGWPFFVSQPSEGSYAFLNRFDGVQQTITLAQDILVTADAPAIAFDYRAAWAFGVIAPATQDRTFSVNILDGGVDHRTLLLTAQHGTTPGQGQCTSSGCNAPPDTLGFVPDTGLLSATLDLTPYIGDTVSLVFEWNIPETFTGPGFFQLDNITAVSTAVPEPSTLLLLSSGLAGLGGMAWRRHRRG